MSALLLLKTVGKHSLGASYLNPQIRQINHPPSPGRSGNCGSDKDKHVWYHLNVESENVKLVKTVEWWSAGVGVGE